MKKVNLLFTVICLLISIFFFSCKKKAHAVDNKVTFDSIRVDETFYMSNDTTQPSCNLQINFIYPQSCENSQLLSTIQNLFTENLLGEDFSNIPPREAVQSYKTQYINEFKRFQSNTSPGDSIDSEELEDETGHSYYSWIKNAIAYNQNGLISFTVEYQNYEGGAHGSHSIYGYVLELKTGKLIQEDHFFGSGYKKDLATLIIAKIAEANGVKDPKDLEEIGFNSIDDIAPNGNFTVDSKGITYYFNENEIAAYVMGLTQVFIPYEEISIYMKKDNPVAPLAGL